MMNINLTLRDQSISPKGQTLIYYRYAKIYLCDLYIFTSVYSYMSIS